MNGDVIPLGSHVGPRIEFQSRDSGCYSLEPCLPFSSAAEIRERLRALRPTHQQLTETEQWVARTMKVTQRLATEAAELHKLHLEIAKLAACVLVGAIAIGGVARLLQARRR